MSEGGSKSLIPVNRPLLDGNEKKYVLEALDTGWISSEGPFVSEFEKQFSSSVGRKYGVAVANGTAALEIAVKSLGIGAGDEVVMPTFSIISCAGAIVKAGAIPVLIDSDPETWNVDVARIETQITDRTKAIMIVHIYGLPVHMDPVLELANKYGLMIVEDAAEMHGQYYKGKPCGSFGDISTFSFYPNKHITTGEGGMIVTDNEELDEKCRSYRNLCFNNKQRFIHDDLGWNYRMSNLQAALGLAQLEKLTEHVNWKKEVGGMYNKLLSDLDNIQLPLPSTSFAENIYWVYGIVLGDKVPFNAKEAMNKLAKKGIGTRPFFWPMHEQPVFINMGLFKNESHPVAERIARRGFYVPSGLSLSMHEIVRVANALHQVLV